MQSLHTMDRMGWSNGCGVGKPATMVDKKPAALMVGSIPALHDGFIIFRTGTVPDSRADS